MASNAELEELRAEIERQKVLLKKLSDQINPPPRPEWKHQPPDYTAGMSMGRSAMEAMAAVDTSGLQEDLRAFQQKQRSTSSPAEPQRPRGSGWVEPHPLEPPPGIEHCDRLVDAQDRIDRTELAMRLAKTETLQKAAKGAGDDNK
jgi:hypothetical protein